MRYILLLNVLLLFGCGGRQHNQPPQVTVTIQPLAYLVERLTDSDFQIQTLVPPGTGPETYSPTPRQIAGAERSLMLFSVGLLDFEQELAGRIEKNSDAVQMVVLSAGIPLLEGECVSAGRNRHGHGVDPHIWTSPANLKQMAANVLESLEERFPDSIRYRANYLRLVNELDSLDNRIRTRLQRSGTEAFVIYHPALSYYANEYGLEQIALESEGKEPTADHLRKVIDRARMEGIGTFLYQRQFPRSVVETAAADAGATVEQIDPLAKDIPATLLSITDLITVQ